jgi:hypothetical protein
MLAIMLFRGAVAIRKMLLVLCSASIIYSVCIHVYLRIVNLPDRLKLELLSIRKRRFFMKANIKSKTSENILLMILLGLILAFPIAAEAGRGHHRSNHTHYHYHYHDGYGHSKYRHHSKKHKYKRRHGGYNRIYNPPQHYYNQPYYSPQPGFNYGRSHNVYPPASVYGYPPNRMIGISTGNGSFMLRY